MSTMVRQSERESDEGLCTMGQNKKEGKKTNILTCGGSILTETVC